MFKRQKNNYIGRLQEKIESYLAFIASTSLDITNCQCLIKKRLESHLFFNYCENLVTDPCFNQWQDVGSYLATITYSFFTDAIDSSNVILLFMNASIIGDFLWRGHYYCTSIKMSIFAACSLYEYIWKVKLFMVLIGKKCLGPNIWLETL